MAFADFLAGLKIKKSAGVRVSSATHAAIRKGDAQRALRAWGKAARYYERALELDSGLAHIWIQLGHMRKEAGGFVTAASAYLRALKLNRANNDILGWLYQVVGRLPLEQRREAISSIGHILGFPVLAEFSSARSERAVEAGEIIFDVSDLVAYLGRARRPTGIQRVQIEVIGALLKRSDHPVRICCALEEACQWVEVNQELFLKVVELACKSDHQSDLAWPEILHRLNISILFGEAITFGHSAKIVNLGTSWWLQNYFLQVRNAAADYSVEYIPFVHDLIPVLAPEHCVDGLVEDFISWIIGVFDHARQFLVNSNATKNDLIKVAAMLGREISEADIAVVPLDAAFEHAAGELSSAERNALGLDGKPFVLFVSTIESRKGHMTALHAWQDLHAKYGDAVPRLVCVGNDGWLNDAFHGLLQSDEKLRRQVLLRPRVSDAQLAFLYRACLFTIYPSTFEGWGLPITEALSYGKIVIAADNSSLPEAGGALAYYVETGSPVALSEAVAKFLCNEKEREALEARIAKEFSPRRWDEVAGQIVDIVSQRRAAGNGALLQQVPVMVPGRWYDLSRPRHHRIWRGAGSAESLRVGYGWGIPDDRGAWIRSAGGELRFHIATAGDNRRLLIKFFCGRPTSWTVSVDGRCVDFGDTGEGQVIWAYAPCPSMPAIVSVRVEAHSWDEGQRVGNELALAIEGCILVSSEEDSEIGVIEAISLGRLNRLDRFGRPPDLAQI